MRPVLSLPDVEGGMRLGRAAAQRGRELAHQHPGHDRGLPRLQGEGAEEASETAMRAAKDKARYQLAEALNGWRRRPG